MKVLEKFQFLRNKDCYMKDDQKKEYIAPEMRVYELDCKTVLLQPSPDPDAPAVSGGFD